MLALTWNWNELIAFFRQACPLDSASHVRIISLQEPDVLSATTNPITLRFRALTRRIAAAVSDGSPHLNSICVPVVRERAGQSYFLYQCTRYAIEAGVPVEVRQEFGRDHSDFHAAAQGLTTEAAALELARCGPNTIQLEKETVFRAIVAECFNIPFVYQVCAYLNWSVRRSHPSHRPPRPALTRCAQDLVLVLDRGLDAAVGGAAGAVHEGVHPGGWARAALARDAADAPPPP